MPYAGTRIGLAILRADGVEADGVDLLDDIDAAFAYQVMAGVAYDLTDHLTAGIEYRFLDTTETLDAEIDSTTHNLLFNLRYRFGG